MQRKALFHYTIPSLLLAARAFASANLQTEGEGSNAEGSPSKKYPGASTPNQPPSPTPPLSAAAIGGWYEAFI